MTPQSSALTITPREPLHMLVCSKTNVTEVIFTHIEMDNKWTINFPPNSPLDIQQAVSFSFV